MRDIKFRAWKHRESPEMINDIDFIDWKNGIVGFPYQLSRDTFREDEENINNMILMRYTGLKDKNGVDIYEGDIVHWVTEFISPMDMRTKRKIDINVEVHQKESGEWVMGKAGNTLFEELFDVRVIGNVYENPELLEG